MLKERAASALKHDLTPPPARARIPDVSSSRSSSVPPSGARVGASANRRMPLAVKLLGIGLLLLGVIYGLTLFRDRRTDAPVFRLAGEAGPARVNCVATIAALAVRGPVYHRWD